MADSLVQSVYYLYSLVLAGVFVTYFPASVRTSVINQQYLNVCQCLVYKGGETMRVKVRSV